MPVLTIEMGDLLTGQRGADLSRGRRRDGLFAIGGGGRRHHGNTIIVRTPNRPLTLLALPSSLAAGALHPSCRSPPSEPSWAPFSRRPVAAGVRWQRIRPVATGAVIPRSHAGCTPSAAASKSY